MLVVDIRTKRLKVCPKHIQKYALEMLICKFCRQVQVKGSPEPILEGELFGEIKEEDSTWSIGM